MILARSQPKRAAGVAITITVWYDEPYHQTQTTSGHLDFQIRLTVRQRTRLRELACRVPNRSPLVSAIRCPPDRNVGAVEVDQGRKLRVGNSGAITASVAGKVDMAPKQRWVRNRSRRPFGKSPNPSALGR